VPASVVIGIVLGAIGVAVLAGPRALYFGNSATLAMAAVLLSAASYAAAAVYSRGMLRTADPIGLSAIKFLIAAVILAPIIALRDGVGGYSELSPLGWLALLAVGCLVTGIARCGYVWVISAAGSARASLLTYVVPVAALVLGWLVMGEAPALSRAIGASLVGAALTCALFGRVIAERIQRQFGATLRPAAMETNARS
jgi:drug/metabolite transporter (DMT)-like permease